MSLKDRWMKWLGNDKTEPDFDQYPIGTGVLIDTSLKNSVHTVDPSHSNFKLSQKMGKRLEDAFVRKNGTEEDFEWLCFGNNLELVFSLARGKGEVFPKQEILENDVPPDSVIEVDYRIPAKSHDWLVEMIHPARKNWGRYPISNVKECLLDEQKGGRTVSGHKVYERLKEFQIIEFSLGLRDLEEIQKRGLHFFRTFFEGKGVFGWGTIATDNKGGLHVPRLFEQGGAVVLGWRSLDANWSGSNPALHF